MSKGSLTIIFVILSTLLPTVPSRRRNNRAGPPDSRGKPASQGGAPKTKTFALFYPHPQ